jgi:hypothetical protein
MLDDFLQTHHLMHSSKGVFWRQFVMGGAEPEAWKYMSVAVPAACIAGPLGALLVSIPRIRFGRRAFENFFLLHTTIHAIH